MAMASLRVLTAVLSMSFVSVAFGAPKIALLSTEFVLERKFELMQAAAEREGVSLAWVQVDRADAAAIDNALDGAALVVIDAPRSDDRARVEEAAGGALRAATLPALHISVMNPPERLRAEGLPQAFAEQVYAYYVSGTTVNHERLFRYLRTWAEDGDLATVPPPRPLPDGGIWHPAAPEPVFADPRAYLEWWSERHGKAWDSLPVIGVEISSSYIADGQTRMLDELVYALEAKGAVPLMFYRSTRLARRDAPSRRQSATPRAADNGKPGFPNPKVRRKVEIDEPMIELDGRLLPEVLLVNTFLGGNPEGRKAWHQALDIPVVNIVNYRGGDRAAYRADRAGIGSFHLPFTLTSAEYIGLIDPVVVSTNEGGELVPMPEQLDMLVGKAVNLARLGRKANADKRLALLFWNHPPGEHNQGASNLNVPRSLERLTQRLKDEGYAVEPIAEQALIDSVATLLAPRYRPDGLTRLMQTPHWEGLPLARYLAWYATLPEEVRADIEAYWGPPAASRSLARVKGEPQFVVPRLKLGHLVIMPQPSRGDGSSDDEEKHIFHDVKVPVHHGYLAAYLWIREQLGADAIIHFGTHGSQEWMPGKERGLWAFDQPNLLVGDTPVVYPYIVDNIGEAIHVKRRGRGVIVSHQTPPFSPAGLSDDFVVINDLIREYRSLDEGLVKANNRTLIIEQAVKMNIHQDLGWKVADLEARFEDFLRAIEDHLEDVGMAMQPLGLHTFAETALPEHRVSTVMQMLGQPLYDHLGIADPKVVFRVDYRELEDSVPYRFVHDEVFSDKPLEAYEDAARRELVAQGRAFDRDLDAQSEHAGILRALGARWVDPSYGGDPIRNPDALPTGRNMYGFDPSRVPTRAAYAAGVEAMQSLILAHQASHGEFPRKLAFTLWSTETMRHLGMLEAQILYAMGVRPVWDQGGRVIDMEVIPLTELGRPRIDTVISLTGLYRDQFPNVMEWFNRAIVMLAELDEPESDNPIRRNTLVIERLLRERGVAAGEARLFALTRVFGTESGDYGTRLPDATLASDRWEEGDGQLENLYLSRMSWAYGPDSSQWSRKLRDAGGAEINAYAEHLRGTSAAVFSRSSNLRGLLDTDHPFEYLGGISMAVRHLDGDAPQLYISNMRDPLKARLQTAERFLSTELRAVYQHPNWVAEMQAEGYAGTLQLLNTINNFWGWQVMDRNVVRDDQWQEFHATYVMDRYELGVREWFEQTNPTALAQIAERMLEAARKGYWKTDEQTLRELTEIWMDIAERHDVYTANETFKAYVQELAVGFGLGVATVDAATPSAQTEAAAEPPDAAAEPETETTQPAEVVQGQVLRELQATAAEDVPPPWQGLLPLLLLLAGFVHQARRARPNFNPKGSTA
ncbi:MAG: cobaltochelatase subunit CobN [Ectothiorhodospiraceae bacterium]|nr:cobaltochelatase subunit CobN [Ectothiorhodospiraceae bacterium]